MKRAYVSAKLKDELPLREQRDTIWNVINGSAYYKKVDPHITVIPPFTMKEGHEKDVKREVEQVDLKGTEVRMKEVDVYESIDKPYVVLVQVDTEIREKQLSLKESLEQYANGGIIQPPEPHITLFKTLGFWDDLPDGLSSRLEREINNRRPVRDTEIRSVTADVN